MDPAELRAHVRVVLHRSHDGAHQPDRLAKLLSAKQRTDDCNAN